MSVQLAAVLIVLAWVAGVALYRWLEHGRSKAGTVATAPGWVYLASPVGGADDDPPAPIKIGYTLGDPAERIKDLETGSPRPLEIIHLFPSSQPALLESMIHRFLAPWRIKGEWFHRDATLAWLDSVKEYE